MSLLQYNIINLHQHVHGTPPREYKTSKLVAEHVYPNEPESYANGSLLLVGSPLLDMSKGRSQTKNTPEENPNGSNGRGDPQYGDTWQKRILWGRPGF